MSSELRLHARAYGFGERFHARELRGFGAHGIAQLLHQPVHASHGARVVGGKRLLAREDVGALGRFVFERRCDQRIDVGHHELRVRHQMRVFGSIAPRSES